MSSTIFSSLTTFFSRGGHHSPPHPTISPQPTITLTKQFPSRVKKITKIDFVENITRGRLEAGWDITHYCWWP
ncbi:hypothetical protein Hanom_Chr13g01184891 [Helianthus anomalus]